MSRGWWVSAGWVTVGTMVANVCAYLVHLPAGRWLGPEGYGEFAVLMAAMLVLAVPAMAWQAVAAREVVRGRDVGEIWSLTVRVAIAVALALIPATPLMMLVADTSASTTVAGLAAAPGLVVLSGGQGVLQGARRFAALSVVVALIGLLRWVPVVVALAVGGGATAGLAAAAGGTFAGGALAWWAVRRTVVDGARPTPRTGVAGGSGTGVLDVVRASQAQFVLVIAVSIDLLMSRSVLGETDAGIYALGAIATKAAFWLPQAIGVVLYPSLADPTTSRRSLGQALGVVAGIGVVITVAAAIAGPVVPMVVSEDYRPLSAILWIFAYTGAMLALLQVVLLWSIARDATIVAALAWVVVGVEAAVIVFVADSVLSLAVIAAVTATCSTAATVLAALAVVRRSVPGPAARDRHGPDPGPDVPADARPDPGSSSTGRARGR